MSKDMRAGNRPNSNTESGLTPNGGGPEGERPGSALERNAAGSPRAALAGVRRFFTPGTPASAAAGPAGFGGLPADVDALAADVGRPSCAAGVVAAEVATAAPTAGVETEASSRPGAAGPAAEPGAQPGRRGHRRVGRRVGVLGDVAHANPCTSPPGGPFSVWR